MADFQSRSSGERALGQTFGDFVAGVSYSISFGTKGIALDAQVAVLGLSAKAGYSTSSLTTFGNLSAYVGVGEVFGTGAYGQKGFAGIGLSTRDGPVAQASYGFNVLGRSNTVSHTVSLQTAIDAFKNDLDAPPEISPNRYGDIFSTREALEFDNRAAEVAAARAASIQPGAYELTPDQITAARADVDVIAAERMADERAALERSSRLRKNPLA